MATVSPVFSRLEQDESTLKVVYSNMNAANNVGAAIAFSQWADRSVQVVGTFNGANMAWEGSNDGGNAWFTLTDPQGNPILKAAAAGEAVTEIVQLARPNVTGGGVATDLTVAAVLRRANPLRT